MNFSTRRAVVIGLLVAQALTLLAFLFLAGRVSADAESQHQNGLLTTKSAEVIDRMRAHLEPAESVVRFSASLLEQAEVESETLIPTFIAAMEASEQLDGVYIGKPDGSFVYVSRSEANYRVKIIRTQGNARSTEIVMYSADADEFDRSEDPEDTYNPVERPWYQQASSSNGDVTWTDPYVFFTSQQLGITAAMPIERDGDVVGVVGADLELGSLSTFLSSLDIGIDGGAIIINQDGTVIAHPDPKLVQRQEGGSFSTVAISNLDDDRARAAVGSFVERGSSTAELSVFENDVVGPSRAAFRNVGVGDGEWTVAVFGPEDGLVDDLASARSTERSLLAIAGLLALVVVGAVAMKATRPLDMLDLHARSDALTGLANRRSILRTADKDIANSEVPGALAMIDIDNFKLVNDTYGHQVGDEVLAEVAARALDCLDNSASIGRIGGEEFLLVMPGSDTSAAWKMCEDVRAAIRSEPFEASTGSIEATVSIGLAIANGPVRRDALLAKADLALFEAKAAGRDKVVAAGSAERSNL